MPHKCQVLPPLLKFIFLHNRFNFSFSPRKMHIFLIRKAEFHIDHFSHWQKRTLTGPSIALVHTISKRGKRDSIVMEATEQLRELSLAFYYSVHYIQKFFHSSYQSPLFQWLIIYPLYHHTFYVRIDVKERKPEKIFLRLDLLKKQQQQLKGSPFMFVRKIKCERKLITGK